MKAAPNGQPTVGTEIAALQSVGDLLLKKPASEHYSEDQKRGCLACALRLPDPKLGDILERLHQLAIPLWTRGKNPEMAVLKAIALLLDVCSSGNDVLLDTLVWRLARERAWRRDHRLRALAMLLQSSSAEVEDLLKLALRTPQTLMVAALCILTDADAGDKLRETQQNIVLRLGRGRLPKVVEETAAKILGLLLRCDPVEAKLSAALKESGWGPEAVEVARRIAQGQVGDASLETLDVAAINALQREPREKQLKALAGMVGMRKESAREATPQNAPQESAIVAALVTKAETLPGDMVCAALSIILGTQPLGSNDKSLDNLARRIGAGSRGLSTADHRIKAFACLFQTAASREAVLMRVARSFKSGSLPQRLCRDVAECLLLGKALATAERGRERVPASQATLLNALQKADDLPATARRTIMDILPSPKVGAETSSPAPRHVEKAAEDAPVKAPVQPSTTRETEAPVEAAATASPTGRFGMGELELLPLDDDEDDEAPTQASEKVETSEKKEKGGEAGWEALKALITEDEEPEEEDEDADVDEEEEEEEVSETDVKADAEKDGNSEKPANNSTSTSGEKRGANTSVTGSATPATATTASRTSTSRKVPEKERKESSMLDDDDDEELDEDSEIDEAEDFKELGESGEEEAGSCGGVSELSDLDDQDSYKGSELDPLDAPRVEDSDVDSAGEISNEDDDDMDLGGGLLTSMFSGGSLHSEEGKGKGGGKMKKPSSIRVVFPSLIWRGKDMLVVNKPADWICSASDVDKKKGRALDPNEKVGTKGFKALADLLSYQFCDREKKYIHWWIQLLHDLDQESYPNLFDEDQNYGLCHRLDRETSGTVLVGLTQLARQQMRECFHRHYVRKLYVCLVHGTVSPAEQTIDRNLEAMGQKARLHANGKRSRTHVKVLGYYTRHKNGKTDEFTLCTCEIAEGRMHQIRLHMSEALGAPIVSEFYYQKPKQMAEDRRWCERVFLHAYAVGFPDVSGEKRRIGVGDGAEGSPTAAEGEKEANGEEKKKNPRDRVPDDGLVDQEKRDTEQEWHACICPLTVELRDALKELEPKNEEAALLRTTIVTSGLLEEGHEEIHVMGTVTRNNQIDNVFFPWSSTVNPIEAGDLNRPRDTAQRSPDSKGGGKGEDGAALRPKAKPRRAMGKRGGKGKDDRGASASPQRRHEPRRKQRMRVASRGRARSPGPPPPPRSRSPNSPPPGPPPPPRQGRRVVRSRSGRPVRGRRSMSRRPPGAPPSPRRSLSPGPPRRKRRRVPVSPTRGSVSPPHRGGPSGPRGPPPPPVRGRRGGGGAGGGGGGGGGGSGYSGGDAAFCG